MQRGWIPIRFFWVDGRPMVDWCLLGSQRLTEPFFEGSILRAIEHPFHNAFRRQTPVEALGEWSLESPGIQPAGFIFHQSRCGSTLISRMLAALERNVVLSEPAPADAVLRAHFRRPDISDAQRVEWFRWMVSALGQPRAGGEDRLFIKFDAWNIAELPIIRQAFPDTPWMFLYREPVEVLVSQMARPAPWTFPGILHPAVVGLDLNSAMQLRHAQYCALILATVCRFGLKHHREDGGLLVNYRQLPEIVPSRVADYFGLNCTAADVECMRAAALPDAKQPSAAFTADSATKQKSAGEELRELARTVMQPVYGELESFRDALAIPAKRFPARAPLST
jgi:hypothetical protein